MTTNRKSKIILFSGDIMLLVTNSHIEEFKSNINYYQTI
jgi:hypothetical protein